VSKPAFSIIIAAAIVLAAAAFENAAGSLPIASPVLLPVEELPSTVGKWKVTREIPTGFDLQDRLRTAHIVERTYTSDQFGSIDVLLLTASNRDDIHDPNSCFPSQGWALSGKGTVDVQGQSVKTMLAAHDQQKALVWYWYDGFYQPVIKSPVLARISDARIRAMGSEDAKSLFVRLMAPDTDFGRKGLQDFVTAARPQLKSIVNRPYDKSPSAYVRP